MQTRDFTDFSFKDIATYIKKYWIWIILSSMSAALGTYVQFYDSSKYISTARFSILKSESSHIQQLTAQLSGAGGMYNDPSETLFRKYMLYFSSRELGEKVLLELTKNNLDHLVLNLTGNPNSFKHMVIKKLKLEKFLMRYGLFKEPQPKNNILSNRNHMVGLINSSISVSRDETGVVSITVRSNDPNTSVVIANFVMDAALEEVTHSDLLEVHESKKFLDTQVDEVKERLDRIEHALSKVKSKSQGGDLAKKEAERHLTSLKNKLIDAQANKGQVDELITRAFNSRKSLDYSGRGKINKLQRESLYWKSKIASLKKLIGQVENEMPKDDGSLMDLTQSAQNLSRQKEFEFAHLESLQRLALQMKVKAISIKGKTRIVERASMGAVMQSSLPIEGIATAMLIAACLVIMIFYLKESLSPEVRSKEDLLNFDLLNFGSVPDLTFSNNISRFARKVNLKTDLPPELRNSPLYIPPDSPQAFVFGAIRSKIYHNIVNAENEHKVISVTSPRQGEGKSMITGKLATSLALTGKKVLLVDADLIRKDLTIQMNLGEREGLKEVLYQGVSLKDVVVKNSYFENLDILPAGTGRGSIADILLTRASSQFFSDCREGWDIVLIDTPALLIAPDALLLCRYSDITTLVFTIDQTKVNDVHTAYGELTDNGVNNIGYILNRSGSLLKYVYYQPTKQPSRKTHRKKSG